MREQGTTATSQLQELSLEEVVEIACDRYFEHMEPPNEEN
jgi:hypothetical protein